MNFFNLVVQIFKANVEAGRRLSRDEFIAHQERKIDAAERHMFFSAVGRLSVAWGRVELLLDYSNLLIIWSFETKEPHLPVALKPKIAFFKKYFQTMSALAPYRERAADIIERINNLKETRHDIVHGIADQKTSEGIRRITRLNYNGKKLIRKAKKYSLDEIMAKTEEILAVATAISDLLSEIIEIDFSKESNDALC